MLYLKDEIYNRLKEIKEATGQAMTNQIYGYIYKGMLNEGLVSLVELKTVSKIEYENNGARVK